MQMVIYIVQRVRRRAAPVMRTRTPAVRRSDQRAMGRVALRLSSPRAMTCTSASGISSNRRNRTLSLALRGARTSAYSFTGFVRALYFLLLRTPFLTYLPTHSLTLSLSLSLSLSLFRPVYFAQHNIFGAKPPQATVNSRFSSRPSDRRGPTPPSTQHSDIVTCVVLVQAPLRLLVTASRDGELKFWAMKASRSRD